MRLIADNLYAQLSDKNQDRVVLCAKLPDAAFMEKMAKLGPEERGKEAIVPVTQLLINRVGTTCMNCHDHDSDPNFDLYKYWGKINHSGLAPKEGWPDKVSGKDK